MAGTAQLAFVSAPAASPTINLNLAQPGLLTVKRDSFSLGAPTFEGDPYSGLGGYGERTAEFTLQATGTYDEAATIFQDVSQQIVNGAPGQGGRNFLMIRWSPSDPVMFLWSCPSSFSPLDFADSGAGVWEMPVQLLCDGYIYGAPVDIASFTVQNDPSTGTNRMMVGPSILGAVQGDAPTPLLLALTAASAGFVPAYVSSYSVRGFTHTFLARNLTDLTSGTDVGARVTGAGVQYVDGDYKSCSFATTALAARLTGSFATSLIPMPGLYRAILKGTVPSVASGAHVNAYSFQINFGGSVSTDLSTVTIQANIGSDAHSIVDLGVVQIPAGVAPDGIGLASPVSAASANAAVTVGASLVNVTGSVQPFRFDELYLLPVDTAYGDARTAITTPVGLAADTVIFDGIQESVRQLDDTGTGPFSATPYPTTAVNSPSWVGGLPIVVPGANNYVQLVAGTGSGSVTNGSPNSTTTWQARYYPRYVHPRPSAS